MQPIETTRAEDRTRLFLVVGGVVGMILVAFLLCSLGTYVLGEATEDPTPTTDPNEELAEIDPNEITEDPITATALPLATAVVPTQSSPVTPTLAGGANLVPAATSAVANCTVPTGWVAYTVVEGDTLSIIAENTGTTVADLAAANCIGDTDTILAGQQLYIPGTVAGQTTTCANTWFFAFDPNLSAPIHPCPAAVAQVEARGLNFENGRAYRYAAPLGVTDTRATIYVIYNNGTWETYPDVWGTNVATDPSIVAPTNRFQPSGAIGALWRENPTVQTALGWALESAPIPFTGRFQLPEGSTEYIYIDHGVQNLVLRLRSVNNAPNTWEIAGTYS